MCACIDEWEQNGWDASVDNIIDLNSIPESFGGSMIGGQSFLSTVKYEGHT